MKRFVDATVGVPLVWFLGFFSERKLGEIPKPNKILIIKLAAMGDTIILVPVIKALREAFPDAQIHWLVSPINKSLAQTFPWIDRIWNLAKMGPFSIFKLITNLRKEQFDVVVDLEQWSRGTGFISFFTKAPYRIGFKTPGQYRDGLFTHVHEKKFEDHEIYDFYHLLSLLHPLQVHSELELWETERGKEELRHQMNRNGDLKKKNYLKILIHPGCGKDGFPREWPLSDYALLGHWLMKTFQGKIFLTGGSDDQRKTDQLSKLLGRKVIDFGGRLSWEATLSLVMEMDLVVSGNTGIMHMAAAFKKKQIALHGPTDPKIWGPLNKNAVVIQSPCPQCPSLKLGFEYHQLNQDCMKKIPLDQVKKAVRSLIDNQGEIC
ncbi:hypothetical protein BVX98_04115 [bacterium F11]|nr:hypothetical protein BVX98_04115 [bacterium F11]